MKCNSIANSELLDENDPPSKRQKTDSDIGFSLQPSDANGNYKPSKLCSGHSSQVSAEGDIISPDLTSFNIESENSAKQTTAHYNEDLNGTNPEDTTKDLTSATSYVDTTLDSNNLNISEAFSVISPATSPDNRFFPESNSKLETPLQYSSSAISNSASSLLNAYNNATNQNIDLHKSNLINPNDLKSIDYSSKLDDSLLKLLTIQNNADQGTTQDNYHERDYCTLIPFQFVRNHTFPHSLNANHCFNCRCFLCDKSPSECLLWTASFGAHCNATSRDAYWRQKRTIYSAYGPPMIHEHDIYKSELLNDLPENQITEAMREAEIFFISTEQNINNAYRLYNSQPSNARRKSARQSRQLCTCKNKDSQELVPSVKKGSQESSTSKELRSIEKQKNNNLDMSGKMDEKVHPNRMSEEICLKCKEDEENDEAGKRRRSYSDVISKFEPVLAKAEAMLEAENQASAAYVLVSESIRILQNQDPSIFDNGKWALTRKTVFIRLEKLLIRIFIQEELQNSWIQSAIMKCISDFISACSEFNFTLYSNLASWKNNAIQSWISGNDVEGDIIEENFFVVKERKRKLDTNAKANYCRLVKIKPSFPGIQFYIKQNRCVDAVTAFYQMNEKCVQSLDEERIAKIFVNCESSSNMQKALFQILLRYISLKILPKPTIPPQQQEESAKPLTYFINSPLFSSIIEILFKALNEFQIPLPTDEMFKEINRLIAEARQVPCVQLKLPENVSFMTLLITLILRVVLHSPETENIGLPKLLERFMESKCQEPMVYLFGRASTMSKATLEAFGRWLVQIYIPRFGVTNLDLHAMQRFSLNAVAVDLERLGVIVDVMGALQAHAQDEKNKMESRASAEAILHQHGLRLMESLMGCPERNAHADKLSDLLLQVAGFENNQYNPLKHELSLAVCRYKLCRTGDERWLKRILEMMPERSKEEVNLEMIECVASKINSMRSLTTMLPFLVKRGGVKKVGDLIKICAYAEETSENKMLHPEFMNDVTKLLCGKSVSATQRKQLVETIKDHVFAHVHDFFRYAVEKEESMEQQRNLIKAMTEVYPGCVLELCNELWGDIESYMETTGVHAALANAFVEWLCLCKGVFDKSGKLYEFGEKIRKINKGKLGKKINIRKALSEVIKNLLSDIPNSPSTQKMPDMVTPVSKQPTITSTSKSDAVNAAQSAGPTIAAQLPNGQTINILLSNLAPLLMQSTAQQQSPVFTLVMPNGAQANGSVTSSATSQQSSTNSSAFTAMNSINDTNNPGMISSLLAAAAANSQYQQQLPSNLMNNSHQANNSMEEISSQHNGSMPGNNDMSTPIRSSLPNLSNAFMPPFYSSSHYMGMSVPPSSTMSSSHANSSPSFSHVFNSFMPPGQNHQQMNASMQQIPQSHQVYQQHSNWQMAPPYGQQYGPTGMSNHGYMAIPSATSTTGANEMPQMEGSNANDLGQVSASPIEIDQYPNSNPKYCIVSSSENAFNSEDKPNPGSQNLPVQ